ncbi:HupE/UreJ family protein [Merismopedia glauca]|uniref:HupE/UreJ family protein n=1 Tax=Merismopedia glauca CCAP 1448/3 TaxID=1296344 RepID=A0A2T1C576_9CYAN|nr:HupE/UreJ family protein [Merismopedia glauca]PSB03435.1 hypothetical protein C7B64_08470 [Merismopedia glauca CCAP 1448/3]
MNRKWYRYLISFFGALLIAIASATPSQAHWADLSVAEIVVKDTQTQMTLTFPTGLVATADDNKDGQLSSSEVQKHQAELQGFLSDRIQLTDDNRQTPTLTIKPTDIGNLPANLKAQGTTHSTLILTYAWLQPAQGLKIDYNLFVPNVSTARCVATILQGGKVEQRIFTPTDRLFSQKSISESSVWQQVGNFVGLGIEHILTGYDHVLFLVSLLLLGGGINYLLKIVTAFTIAHSITLSLAVLNLVTISPRLVESAIALTIVYVAAENFWRKDVKGRWLITFVFGLVHGLGFAGILTEINIPPSQLPLSLASFNLGVEIGQILIVSTVFILIQKLVKPAWQLKLRYFLSASVIAIGIFWFWERTFLAV